MLEAIAVCREIHVKCVVETRGVSEPCISMPTLECSEFDSLRAIHLNSMMTIIILRMEMQ
jgi:hypothetical protein